MTTQTDAALDVPELIPARMLNEFAYCPRLAYLEWVQGEWEENVHTVDGKYKHRVVDEEKGKLPEGQTSDTRRQTTDEEPERIHAQSVWLSARVLSPAPVWPARARAGPDGRIPPDHRRFRGPPGRQQRDSEAERFH